MKCLVIALLMALCVNVYGINNGDVPVNTVDSARRMIKDLSRHYAREYPKGYSFFPDFLLIFLIFSAH